MFALSGFPDLLMNSTDQIKCFGGLPGIVEEESTIQNDRFVDCHPDSFTQV